jgi:rod shape-determining protein MreC
MSVTLIVVGSSGPFTGIRGRLSGLFAPLRAAGGTVTQPISNLADSVRNTNKLRSENEDLRRRLAEAQSNIAIADDAVRERKELLAMSGLDEITSLKRVTARVATSSLDNFNAKIEIDKGSKDGISVGMPVAAGYGLVGRIVTVTPKASLVLLFTDPGSEVGVRHANSGVVGIIEGDGPGKQMMVSRLDPTALINPGDVMVTSGLVNSRYPAGLEVGTVVSAKQEQGKLDQTVVMKPFAELDRLTFVAVLLWTPPPPVPFEPPVPVSVVAPPSTLVDPTNPTSDQGDVAGGDTAGAPTTVSRPSQSRAKPKPTRPKRSTTKPKRLPLVTEAP